MKRAYRSKGNLRNLYSNQHKTNKIDIKYIRFLCRNKLLLQLEALIKKFDQSIGEKMREKIVLEEEYAQQKKIYDEFMIIFREKEAEYEVAVVQKEQEERERQEKEVAFFIMNRAARIIQRFYRKYRKAKKRLEKELLKRGKGAARRRGKK